MSVTYAGADSFPSNITIPSDGDDDTAAAVDVALEGLADRTAWIKNRLAAAGGVLDLQTVKIHTLLEILSGANLKIDTGATGTIQGDTIVSASSGVTLFTVGQGARLLFSGDGRMLARPVNAVNAGHTYAIGDGNFFSLRNATAFHVYRLSATDAIDGDRMWWSADDATITGGTVQIVDDTGPMNVLLGNVSGAIISCEFYFVNSHWRQGAFRQVP